MFELSKHVLFCKSENSVPAAWDQNIVVVAKYRDYPSLLRYFKFCGSSYPMGHVADVFSSLIKSELEKSYKC